MHFRKSLLALSVIGCVFLCSPAFAEQKDTGGAGSGQALQKEAIPFNRLGAEIDKRGAVQTAGPVATAGGYRLAAKMQALEADVTSGGLTVTSLSKSEGGGSFSIAPVAVNGVKASKGVLPAAQSSTVLLDRGCVSERFSASSDGIRQDFIISKAPAQNASELVLSLAVQGATVKQHGKDSNTALLTLPAGRKLVYGKLKATDAEGKELSARMVIPAAGSRDLQIIVAAQNAAYPITIDPTITDADWSALGSGMNSSVYALAVDASNNVYAGGTFTTAGGLMRYYIAKWNGTSWSALGTGMGGSSPYVYALAFDASGNLYAGGNFTTAGGVTVNRIAKWNGTSWLALGSGMNYSVQALAFDASGNLYAGGGFTTAGGVTVNHIAKWNGTSWSSLGSGMGGDYASVEALAVDSSGNVYAGGGFTTAGGVAANRIAKWNGTSWLALGSGVAGAFSMAYPRVDALTFDSWGHLYVGGMFYTAGGITVYNIAKWDGTSWSALGSGLYGAGPDPEVYALALDASGNVYAGGYFAIAGGVPANYIAVWDGASWSALGSGMGGGTHLPVFALAAETNDYLYAGGSFTTAGGKVSSYIARCKVSGSTTSTTTTSIITTTTTSVEPTTTTTVQADVDTDHDGIPDAIDNCPSVYNPQQLDANSNGIGDVCDPTPGCGGCGQAACEQYADTDGDGIPNVIDNCPNVYNPQQLDANKNGVGDCCDPTPGCGGCGQVACEAVCAP